MGTALITSLLHRKDTKPLDRTQAVRLPALCLVTRFNCDLWERRERWSHGTQQYPRTLPERHYLGQSPRGRPRSPSPTPGALGKGLLSRLQAHQHRSLGSGQGQCPLSRDFVPPFFTYPCRSGTSGAPVSLLSAVPDSNDTGGVRGD